MFSCLPDVDVMSKKCVILSKKMKAFEFEMCRFLKKQYRVEGFKNLFVRIGGKLPFVSRDSFHTLSEQKLVYESKPFQLSSVISTIMICIKKCNQINF